MTWYSDIRMLVKYLHSFTWPPKKPIILLTFVVFPSPVRSTVRTWIFVAVKCVTKICAKHQLPGSFTKLLGFQGGYSSGWCVSEGISMTQDPILLCGDLQKPTTFQKPLSSFCAAWKLFWRSDRELQIDCTGSEGPWMLHRNIHSVSHFFLLVGDKEAFERWWGPWV